jgi:hypothetical protein
MLSILYDINLFFSSTLINHNLSNTNVRGCAVIFKILVGVLDVVSKSKCHEQWRGVAAPLFVALWDLEAKSKTPTRI